MTQTSEQQHFGNVEIEKHEKGFSCDQTVIDRDTEQPRQCANTAFLEIHANGGMTFYSCKTHSKETWIEKLENGNEQEE